MKRVTRQAVVPAYLMLCIGLGGSVQGVWGMAILQILAIAIIAWSLLAKDRLPLPRAAKTLFAISGLVLLLLIVQLLPLPPALWTALPGREPIAQAYALLGQVLPWLPISLTPHETAATVLTLMPPIAVLAAMLVAGAYRASWLVIAILIGTLAAVLLGALQVGSPDPAQSWYLYSRTNHGLATGFFANSNHMATLLMINVPLLFAWIAGLRKQARTPQSRSAALLLSAAGILVLVVGIFLSGSLAALLLGPPVVFVSSTMLLPPSMRSRWSVTAVAGVAVAVILVVYLTPLQDKLLTSNATSVNSRQTMWSNTIPAIKDNLVLGSGLGSFPRVYRQYEDQAAVTRTFVNHAHNDYLEIALETGTPGIFLIAAFLLWWGRRAVPIWRSMAADHYAVSASIATAAILIHSLVDYPLRTAALSAIFAACLALMAPSRVRKGAENADLWPASRHLSV